MILQFPSHETLRFAMMSGLIPAKVMQGPVSADDALRLEFAFRSTKSFREQLAAIGVVSTDGPLAGVIRQYAHWFVLLPLEVTALPEPAADRVVIFVLPSQKTLPSLVQEMLRLGNDRQSIARLADGRVLLRVIAPPYFTLLRALESVEALAAYFEAAPQVWIAAGYSHPLARSITVPDASMVLLAPPDVWELLAEPLWQPLYDVLDFKIDAAERLGPPAEPVQSMTIPLRLAPGSSDVPATLWVIDAGGDQTLQHFVEESPTRLIEQLAFALATDGTVLLRSRGRESPILELPGAVDYCVAQRLPNLFVPRGWRLQPPIRRDIVARLLADDPDWMVWLQSSESGSFTPRSIEESAFRPLVDWVDYVIEREKVNLASWMDEAIFDFDSFVVADVAGAKRAPATAALSGASVRPPLPPIVRETPAVPVVVEVAPLPPVSVEPSIPSQWHIRCDALEKEFLAVEGELDAPARQRLWPALAEANTALGPERRAEAYLCSLHAEWAGAAISWPREDVTAILAKENPTSHDVRLVTAAILGDNPAPLPALRHFVEEHHALFPVRGAWLIALKFAALAGGDPLGLARSRDRILLRLLEHGYEPDRDLPAFLRFAGLRNSDKVRLVRDRIGEVHRAVRDWTAGSLDDDRHPTLAYIDLLFAWGLATIGETTAAHGHVQAARTRLERPDDTDELAMTSTFLFRAYWQRIDDALASRRHGGLLQGELISTLEDYRRRGEGVANSPHATAVYAIERLREHSAILEPHESLIAWRSFAKNSSPLALQLHALSLVHQPKMLVRQTRELLQAGTAKDRVTVLHDAVLLAPRAGEDFTIELIGSVPDALTATLTNSAGQEDFLQTQARLLAHAIRLAVFFDAEKILARLLKVSINLMTAQPLAGRYETVATLARPTIRSLARLTSQDILARYVKSLESNVLENQPLSLTGKADALPAVQRAYLALAAGHLALGEVDVATPIMDIVRERIAVPRDMKLVDSVKLTRTYLAALGSGPVEWSIPRILDVFAQVEPQRIPNRQATARHYSLFHLQFAEEAVLALASDDSQAGRESRRWLDEDELLVRRRIHADVRRLVGTQTGES